MEELLMKIKLNADELIIDIAIPPSKNKKSTVFNTRTAEVKRFYYDCHTGTIEYMHMVQSFLKDFDSKKELLNIEIFHFQEYDRGDLHNTNEILADGLQELLGVNDLYYVIRNNPRRYHPREHLEIIIKRIENRFASERKETKKAKK